MSIRVPLLISLVLVLAMAGSGAWAWQMLPPHAVIAVHWNLDGRPNGFASKTFGLFVIPATGAIISLAMAVIPRLEPRRLNLAASAKLYIAAWIGALLVTTVAQAMIVATALRAPFDGRGAVVIALSLLFIVLGNFFGKTRPNFFAGIRTPWTLSSDLSWEKTHRLGGHLFVGVGAATLTVLGAAGTKMAMMFILAALLLSVLVSVVMSYVYWKRDPDKVSGNIVPD